jgi:hypothetical protein
MCFGGGEQPAAPVNNPTTSLDGSYTAVKTDEADRKAPDKETTTQEPQPYQRQGATGISNPNM